jgi:hypothetical protein
MVPNPNLKVGLQRCFEYVWGENNWKLCRKWTIYRDWLANRGIQVATRQRTRVGLLGHVADSWDTWHRVLPRFMGAVTRGIATWHVFLLPLVVLETCFRDSRYVRTPFCAPFSPTDSYFRDLSNPYKNTFWSVRNIWALVRGTSACHNFRSEPRFKISLSLILIIFLPWSLILAYLLDSPWHPFIILTCY